MPLVIVKLLAFNAIQSVYMATAASSIPVLVPSNKLISGNAVIMVINTLSMSGGMAIAGIMYDRFGLFPILIGCAVCFTITAIADLFIRIPYKKQETSIAMGLVFLFDVTNMVAYIVLTAAVVAFLISAKILSIAIITFVQQETPIELIGKVMSVGMIAPFIGQAIGYPLLGLLFHQFSASPWIVIFGAVFAVIIMSVYKYRQFKNIGRTGNGNV